MKKQLMTVLFCAFACVSLAAAEQDAWKKLPLPKGKNLFSSPTMPPRANNKNLIQDWGNNGGKRLNLSWKNNILQVTSTQKGYHLGIARVLNLKPNTKYVYYVVCRAEIKGAGSQLIMLYADGKLPNWKKSVVSGTAGVMKKSFPWRVFKREIRTPDANTTIRTAFYPMLFHGTVKVDIAYAGLIELGPVVTKLKPLNPKYKNILNNPTLKNGPNGLPYNWNIEFTDEYENIVSKNGVVTLKKPAPVKQAFQTGSSDVVILRQGEMVLNPGKKYRISAWVKTENFIAPRSGIIVYNFAWTQAVGIEKFPENTNGWKKFEKDVVLPKSKWSCYTFAVYTAGTKGGLLHVKDLSLRPVDDAAAANIKKAPPFRTLYRITPIQPLLSDMDSRTGKMTFSFDYVLPRKESDYVSRVRFKAKNAKNYSAAKTFPLKNKRIVSALGKLPVGEGSLHVVLAEKKTGKVLAEETYNVLVKAPVKISRKVEKRLNMLAQRLLTGTVQKNGQGKYLFSAPRRTWVWIQIPAKAPEKCVVKLNGKSLKGHFHPGFFETLRLLPAGDHTLELANALPGKGFKVNSVPEVFVYSYPWTPQKTNYPTYRKEFYNKYVFPIITTVNHGYRTHDSIRLMYESYGKRWFPLSLAPHKLNKFYTPEEWAKKLRPWMTKAVHGIAFDEIFMSSITEKWLYTQALRYLTSTSYSVYTWSSGVKFRINGLNADYFSATVNTGRGTGKFLFECYARTQPNEKAADAYLEDYLNESMRRANQLMPNAAQHSLMILGGYARPGNYLTDVFVEPDVKVFWDKFFYRLANDKEFQDLYGVGIYSYYHTTEEAFRWVNKMIRHYCFEGNKESLTKKYGYKYIPGHIKNGDFKQKLAHWKAVPAEKGSIKPGHIKSYGLTFQGRRGWPRTEGDHFCTFKRSAKAPNKLSTTLTGLEKGKLYVLRYAVLDGADVKKKKISGRKLGLYATFTGAKDITAASPAGKYIAPDGVYIQRYVNNVTRVFRAENSSVTLTFSDWKGNVAGGKIGQEQLLNFVRVAPYFDEK